MSMPKDYAQKDYYSILGVNADATTDEINKAFKGIASKWHPDKAPADQEELFRAKFQEAEEAKRILSDEGTRAEYNLGRREYLKTASAPHMAAPRTSVSVVEEVAHPVVRVKTSAPEFAGVSVGGKDSFLKGKKGVVAAAFVALAAISGVYLWNKAPETAPTHETPNTPKSLFMARLRGEMTSNVRMRDMQDKLGITDADASRISRKFFRLPGKDGKEAFPLDDVVAKIDKGEAADMAAELTEGKTAKLVVDRNKVAIQIVNKDGSAGRSTVYQNDPFTVAAYAPDREKVEAQILEKRMPTPRPAQRPAP